MKDCRQFYIDGKWVAPTTPNDFPVTNPATEETIATISLGSAADVDKAVAAARRAFETFSETSREERLELLQRIIAAYQSKYQWDMEGFSEPVYALLPYTAFGLIENAGRFATTATRWRFPSG